jgi:hypothetical protein
VSPTNPSAVPGRYRLLGAEGAELEAADATFTVEPEALVVQPRQQATLRIDLADADGLELGDHWLRLVLGSGERVEASMLGRRFGELGDSLGASLTVYQARNLLLEEPVGGEAFECEVARDGSQSPSQVRVWATSLSVLPKLGTPYGIPFGEVSGSTFDTDRYAVDLATDRGTVSLLRLGKLSQPCARLIESRLAGLAQRTAAAVAYLVPLSSLTGRRLNQLLKDGVPVSRARIDAVAPTIWPALVDAAIPTGKLRQSFESLAALCPPAEIAVGIKETNARQDQPDEEVEPDALPPEEAAAAADEDGTPGDVSPDASGEKETPMTGRVVWFAFPITSDDRDRPGNALAVEAVTRGGRATYLFRIAPPEVYRKATAEELRQLARERIVSVSRALVALSFKREPIYLTDQKIRTGPYARYRLALRLSGPLKSSRATFLGRAIHGPAWKGQLDAALARVSEEQTPRQGG